jgi:type IV pilus assembly protein PilA
MHERDDARAADRSECGFTIIELMMVVLIIAILIAVLIPTFFAATQRANDRAMQTSLRNAITAVKALVADDVDYTAATPAVLNREGAPVKFIAGGVAPVGQNQVSVQPVAVDYIVIAGESKSGTCFYVADDRGAGTWYAKLPGGGGCAATGAPAPGNPAWTNAW